MTEFCMIRNHDENGISGTGKVLEGKVFSSGKTVVEWTTNRQNSIGVFECFSDFLAIHVFSHLANQTEIRTNKYELINGA